MSIDYEEIRKIMLGDFQNIASIQSARKDLLTSKIRCEEEIYLWVTKVCQMVDNMGRELVEQVEKMHLKEEDKLLQIELGLSRYIRDLNMALETQKCGEIANLLESKGKLLVDDVGVILFTPNICLRNLEISDLGSLIISHSNSKLSGDVCVLNTKDKDGILSKNKLSAFPFVGSGLSSKITKSVKEQSGLSPIKITSTSSSNCDNKTGCSIQVVNSDSGNITPSQEKIFPLEEKSSFAHCRKEAIIFGQSSRELGCYLEGINKCAKNDLADDYKYSSLSDAIVTSSKFDEQCISIKAKIVNNVDIKWPSGTRVLARWSKDNIWYRARVERQEIGDILVTFVDYGNTDMVGLDSVVVDYKDIPIDQRDMVDENVEIVKDKLTDQLVSGTHCLVKVDQEWKPAVIHSFHKQVLNKQTYVVKLLYNRRYCLFDREKIALGFNQEPRQVDLINIEVVDNDNIDNVGSTVREIKFVEKHDNLDELNTTDYQKMKMGVENITLETFNDFPDGKIISNNICENQVKIPPEFRCNLCENLSRRAMRLVCDRTVVCWSCAVKEINKKHVCWKCGQLKIRTTNHLVKDESLRLVVQELKETGLNPSLLQGLGAPEQMSANIPQDELVDVN